MRMNVINVKQQSNYFMALVAFKVAFSDEFKTLLNPHIMMAEVLLNQDRILDCTKCQCILSIYNFAI